MARCCNPAAPPRKDAIRVHIVLRKDGVKRVLIGRGRDLPLLCALKTGPFESGVFRYAFLARRGAESDESE